MTYKRKNRIKALIAAGLLSLNLSGCKKTIKGYSNPPQETEISEKAFSGIKEFKEELQRGFLNFDVTLDKSSDEYISSIIIDGTNVSIELSDGSIEIGTLYSLKISDISFENFYIYDSQFIDDLYNVEERYANCKEKGYSYPIDELYAEYKKHPKLNLETQNCSVNNEYKRAEMEDIEWLTRIDYSNCRKLWLENEYLTESQFSDMPNLETLVLVTPNMTFLDEEVIKIQSSSLKNIIIDGQSPVFYTDHYDFTGCPNLEIVSLPNDSQETNLNGLEGLKNLRQISFGVPKQSNLSGKVLGDFQDRIDLISKTFPTDDLSLAYPVNNFISDISGINGSQIEVLNVSFLKRVTSGMLLETIKTLPSLKQIIGFEVNNAGMCSDELIEYCESHGIEHPFTDKSLEIKHKLQEIVSNVVTEDMGEEEKIQALSEYIITHMEYDYNLTISPEESADKIKKGWGECLYYSIIEGEGVCQGYTMYAQNLFTEAGITSYKINGLAHTWNLVQIDNEYYFVDLTNIDGIINEGESISFDDYNLDTYYLVPVDEEWRFYTYELPIEAEKEYNAGNEKRKSGKIETGSYIVQASNKELSAKSYSKFCGMIGVLSARGLATKVERIGQNCKDGQTTNKMLTNREDVIKVTSLSELLSKLKRTQKVDKLRTKRDIANRERDRNRKAKALEREVNEINKGEDAR